GDVECNLTMAVCAADHGEHVAADVLVANRARLLEAEVLSDGHRPWADRLAHGRVYARRAERRKGRNGLLRRAARRSRRSARLDDRRANQVVELRPLAVDVRVSSLEQGALFAGAHAAARRLAVPVIETVDDIHSFDDMTHR